VQTSRQKTCLLAGSDKRLIYLIFEMRWSAKANVLADLCFIDVIRNHDTSRELRNVSVGRNRKKEDTGQKPEVRTFGSLILNQIFEMQSAAAGYCRRIHSDSETVLRAVASAASEVTQLRGRRSLSLAVLIR
jgi:hypothetical protein